MVSGSHVRLLRPLGIRGVAAPEMQAGLGWFLIFAYPASAESIFCHTSASEAVFSPTTPINGAIHDVFFINITSDYGG
jgi:hypothetical protein